MFEMLKCYDHDFKLFGFAPDLSLIIIRFVHLSNKQFPGFRTGVFLFIVDPSQGKAKDL